MWWAISPIRWVFGLGLKVTGISEFTLEYNPLIRGRVAFSERFFLAIIQEKKIIQGEILTSIFNS